MVDAPAPAVKGLTCQIEEADGLGRLFDMDVLAPDGRKLDRGELGLPPRRCLICGGPAAECASRRAHTARELQGRTRKVLCEYFHRKFAGRIAALATQSLLYEVSVTPKPGLVDRANNGSHPDMDFYTFLRSAATLTPWFRDMAGHTFRRKVPRGGVPSPQLPGAAGGADYVPGHRGSERPQGRDFLHRSAGGCADLLAICWLEMFIEKDNSIPSP